MRSGLLLLGAPSPGRAEETLDAYVRSISQLAQPCAVGSEPPRPCRTARIRARGSASRSADRSQPAATSLQDITAQFNGQQSSPGLPSAADPLAWLYGLSDPKQQTRSPAARPTQPGPESDLQAAPGPLAAVPRLGPPSVPGRSQRSRRRVALHCSVMRGRPGRPQRPCLPVIYEL
ncbi:protein DEPP1 [Nothoprocta perdicaria]|nr:protein DEPP1 [Nothoprocta perdicaria]